MLERLSSVVRNTKDFELVARYQQSGDALGQGAMFNYLHECQVGFQ